MDPVDPQASSETVQSSCSCSDPSRLKRVRLVHGDRRQLCWTMLDVERLVDEDHPVRAIWELVGRLDLSAFVDRIGSLEGGAGRPAYDPQLLVSLWIYACSRGIGAGGGASLRARSGLSLADGAAHGIAVGLDVGQTAPDYEYLAPAVDQIEERLGQTPDQMVVDAGYTSREHILAAHEKDVELIGPWVETDAFLPDKFQYDPASDPYTCPEGKRLTARDGHDRPGRRLVRYQASLTDCRACPSRRQCCSGNRTYGRSIVVTHEDPVVSAFRARQASPETRTLLRERGRVAELVNAWLKEKLDLRRFHVRGLAKVGTEALWAVLTYNIQQWLRRRWRPRLGACAA